jgi:DNA-binding NtrC family response regulator
MKCRVLIVDDEQTVLYAMQHFLTTKGFDVLCAIELEEAQALLTNHEFDIVITDLRLSSLQGAEGLMVIKSVRSLASEPRLIVLTAHATLEVEAEARRLGVQLFLRKPASLVDLASTMHRMMEQPA